MPCVNCGRGLHNECLTRCKICHPTPQQLAEKLQGKVTEPPVAKESKEKRPIGRPIKNVEDLIDPKSTGRKRAAILYPIFPDESCEWRFQKSCGGGVKSIIGCKDGKQVHRHHGPIKETNHNHPGNVHRICVTCHNRWHALNNPIYDAEQYATLPHDPQPATEAEIMLNEAWWGMPENRELLDSMNTSGD